jgi:iron complex transport system substrate-binding protein
MRRLLLPVILLLILSCKPNFSDDTQVRTITDSSGRIVEIPLKINNFICSGSGSLRLAVYLQAVDRVCAVDDIEGRTTRFDARPYALANPQFKDLPVFGQFRGFDNPELILGLPTKPDVIFKTYPESGHDPVELENKTGIPVVILDYGNLQNKREDLYNSLKIMGDVLGKQKRADEVIEFIENEINTLVSRTKQTATGEIKSCYIGGVAYRGPHGLQSTEPAYPPFTMANVTNIAFESLEDKSETAHADISKEVLVKYDPDYIFIDLSTLQADAKANALYELKNDPVYRELKAVKQQMVYGVLPYNWYTQNFGSIIADAYFIARLMYPEEFVDIDPQKKADEIYMFLVGKPLFNEMNTQFENLAFKKIEL